VDLLQQERLAPVLDAVSLGSHEPSVGNLYLERAKEGLVVCLESMLRLLRISGGRDANK